MGDLERDTDGHGDQTDDLSSAKSDGSYNTNENPDMSVDINADENERQVADPGYVDPNEKLVDPNEKQVVADSGYVDPNEKQVVADSGYVDPNEKLVDPAPPAPVTCGAPVQVDASYTGDS